MIRPLLDSLSFLTILPFPCPLSGDQAQERMVKGLAWFPVAGALIGAAGGGTGWLASTLFGQAIGAWVGLAAMALLTGGLHLDGFADTMDGLGAWKDREKTLEVMRDSRIGATGAAGMVFLLGIQWSAIRQMAPEFWVAALAGIGALSRVCLVLSAQFFRYVPGRSGVGRLVTDKHSPGSVVVALLLTLGITLACFGFKTAWVLLAGAVAVSWILNLLFTRWLGGVTGDTFGAVSEIVTVFLLLLLVVIG
ncbi:MAG: adenosylcobinamide-GDP ribazoletransferase [Candidatus Omnitrophota bacterium]|nr:adenosylcobinamide-GDP ribazoletransferase [Candidatus Omnitrophota bacterium]